MHGVEVEVTLRCLSPAAFPPGAHCGSIDAYCVTGTGDALAEARMRGWTFHRDAARCPACGRAGARFGNATRETTT